MRCSRHAVCNEQGRNGRCLFGGQGAPSVESDSRKFARNVMARQVDPTLRGDYSAPAKYQRLLKSRGLTDDVTNRELCQLTTNTAKRERVREEAIHRITERLREPCLHAISQSRPVSTDTQRRLRHQVAQLFRGR